MRWGETLAKAEQTQVTFEELTRAERPEKGVRRGGTTGISTVRPGACFLLRPVAPYSQCYDASKSIVLPSLTLVLSRAKQVDGGTS